LCVDEEGGSLQIEGTQIPIFDTADGIYTENNEKHDNRMTAIWADELWGKVIEMNTVNFGTDLPTHDSRCLLSPFQFNDIFLLLRQVNRQQSVIVGLIDSLQTEKA
jgi:hypothetical protein